MRIPAKNTGVTQDVPIALASLKMLGKTKYKHTLSGPGTVKSKRTTSWCSKKHITLTHIFNNCNLSPAHTDVATAWHPHRDRFATKKIWNRGQVANMAKRFCWSRRPVSEGIELESIVSCLLNMHKRWAATDFSHDEVSVVAKQSVIDWLVIDRRSKWNGVLSPTDRWQTATNCRPVADQSPTDRRLMTN